MVCTLTLVKTQKQLHTMLPTGCPPRLPALEQDLAYLRTEAVTLRSRLDAIKRRTAAAVAVALLPHTGTRADAEDSAMQATATGAGGNVAAVCRHWKRGGVCFYAAKCKFRHPIEEKGAPSVGTGALDKAGRKTFVDGKKKRARVRKRGKCGHLRRFLLDTFGLEALLEGPVLDVGGGKGELSFELCNLNGVECVIVDPQPVLLSKLAHKWRGGWYHRTLPLQKYNTAPPPPPRARAVGNPGHYDRARATASASGEKADRGQGVGVRDACTVAAGDIAYAVEVRLPLHWRILWDPSLWEGPHGTRATGLGGDCGTEVGSTLALHRAWAAAQTIRFFESGSGVKEVGGHGHDGEHADGGHAPASHLISKAMATLSICAPREPKGNENTHTHTHTHTPSAAVVGEGHGGEPPKPQPTAVSAAGNVNIDGDGDGSVHAHAGCECGGCGDTSTCYQACDAGPPRVEVARRVFSRCSVVVGMHSDQATEAIVDFALRFRKRFAVVPCCVCPTAFPNRRSPGGGPVVSHAEFVEYLVGKGRPGDIKVARLGFEGKDTVLYSAY